MSTPDPALLERARTWLADDPNPATRESLESLIDTAENGDAAAAAKLQDAFAGMLQFGTAGLRGAMGPGPNRMNDSVVSLAAAGIGAWLRERVGDARVVIGFDARCHSEEFARRSAAILTAAGHQTMLMPAAWPTPITAYAVRALDADAGIQVTASHNPAADNGYKVYLGGRATSAEGRGVQIVPPVDAEIAAQIAAVESVSSIPVAESGWTTLGGDVQGEYVQAIQQVLTPGGPRDVSIVHTSMHGVGHDTVMTALSQAGFLTVHAVGAQADPDPDFPTVDFPNPEEPGAIDLALEQARRVGADLVIANDPDADRCAVAVPDPRLGDWRMLTGDELGALLGFALLRRTTESSVYANSIVSSRLLAAIADGAEVKSAQTLTGFKWIARTEDLAFGYEEAIGYCVLPDVVRDKDGISAALAIAELAAEVKADGSSLIGVLDALARHCGLFATSQVSLRVTDLDELGAMMARLRQNPPAQLNGCPVTVTDLAGGTGPGEAGGGVPAGLPPTDAVVLLAEDRSRIIVRPSGTEPKLKCYLEAVEDVAPDASFEDLTGAHQRAQRTLTALAGEIRQVLGVQ
ncbi:phospho-sugar mutase [Helcobacillus massiliensis]|uniref:Phosphomannomutase n=1 Tax=Helcobacillus massiliensis TaxID=521392 RepID=A0A839QSY0_9MICO|nr:phospho-sugar mutase [Helcobacillus massiliensis]MBB3021939.1 phosphomannomutase [Helcobacillus massiliensis]